MRRETLGALGVFVCIDRWVCISSLDISVAIARFVKEIDRYDKIVDPLKCDMAKHTCRVV